MFSAFKIQDELFEFDRVTKSGDSLSLIREEERIQVHCLRREGNKLLLELIMPSNHRITRWVDVLQATRNHEFRLLFNHKESMVNALHDATEAEAEQADYRAPMTAKVVEVLVIGGDQVESGQTLIVLEAMKLQMDIKAHDHARVSEVSVKVGDQVQQGDLLIHMEEEHRE